MNARTILAKSHLDPQIIPGIEKALRQFNYPRAWQLSRNILNAESNPDFFPNQTIRLLQQLSHQSVPMKQKSLLFIPKSNREFWDIYQHPMLRRGTALIAPALSGFAMIEGNPESDPTVPWDDLGLAMYQESASNKHRSQWPDSQADLIQRCRQLGFSRLVVIAPNQTGKVELHEIDSGP